MDEGQVMSTTRAQGDEGPDDKGDDDEEGRTMQNKGWRHGGHKAGQASKAKAWLARLAGQALAGLG